MSEKGTREHGQEPPRAGPGDRPRGLPADPDRCLDPDGGAAEDPSRPLASRLPGCRGCKTPTAWSSHVAAVPRLVEPDWLKPELLPLLMHAVLQMAERQQLGPPRVSGGHTLPSRGPPWAIQARLRSVSTGLTNGPTRHEPPGLRPSSSAASSSPAS